MRSGDETMFCLKRKVVTEAEEGERGERKKGGSGEEGTRTRKRRRGEYCMAHDGGRRMGSFCIPPGLDLFEEKFRSTTS